MKRHALTTRIWHWVNLLALVILFMSGLNISNAHPWLYWGDAGSQPAEAWVRVIRFPGWATIPEYYSLAQARQWHLLLAWVFAVGWLAYLLVSLLNRHLQRDIVTRRSEWRWSAIREDVKAHLRFDFAHGAGKYNFLQKLAYGLVIFLLLPVMILTGMAISPGFEPALPWLPELFGGRQSARTVHFLAAWALAGFLLVHVVLVLLSGPLGQLRRMITGGSIDETA